MSLFPRVRRVRERMAPLLAVAGLLVLPAASGIVETVRGSDFPREQPFRSRELSLSRDDGRIGLGVAYGPYRDGQQPGGLCPGRDELREDLRLLAGRWHLLRVYGAAGPAGDILAVIREERLDLKVMLGAWIEPEESRDDGETAARRRPEIAAANRHEIESAVRLALEYPDLVVAVCVGNETQVDWSQHRCPPELLVRFVREVRARVATPVTVADDFNFWNKPGSREVAGEIDFLVTHLHPMWNGAQLEDALEWVRTALNGVQAVHPGRLVVIGETGWATRRGVVGEQARLIRGVPGEDQQKTYYDSFSAWAERERIPAFFFEAFDENWKGGGHEDDVEKHWGLFRADRTPKRVVADGR